MVYFLKHLTGFKSLQNLRINPTRYLHSGVTEQSNNGGIKWLAGGWSLFLAENVILSENREWICQKYGEKLYHGVYNTLSTVACISILFGYFKHRRYPLHICGSNNIFISLLRIYLDHGRK